MPGEYNYIASFLTFACNLKCKYCINHFEQDIIRRKMLSGKEWVEGLNRLVLREDLPVTLQGGEPSLHPDFIYIINHLDPRINIDILTNLQFKVEDFIKKVKPGRIKRDAPYACIRVSYHPQVMDLDELIKKVMRMLEADFSIGIWSVAHPGYVKVILDAQEKCRKLGIDFRLKEFLGRHGPKMYGSYRYKNACDRKFNKHVQCRTTELLMDSAGNIYRCHSDLYAGIDVIGHILDPDLRVERKFRPCNHFGHCNPCDVKIKTNRFQQSGHTSVEVKF